MESWDKFALFDTIRWLLRFVKLISFVVLAEGSCRKLQVYNDNSLDDMMFDTFLLGESTGINNVYGCTELCQADTGCMSFCYSETERKCRLHGTGFHRPSDGTGANGWKCYRHSDANCPVKDSFVHIRSYNLCVHLASDPYPYADAHQYCVDKNSAFISLPSITKRQAFETLPRTVIAGRFSGVGLELRKKGGVWTWENGDALGTESNWQPGQPYCGVTGPCYCASMLEMWDWRWDDHNCVTPSPVVCEIELQ